MSLADDILDRVASQQVEINRLERELALERRATERLGEAYGALAEILGERLGIEEEVVGGSVRRKLSAEVWVDERFLAQAATNRQQKVEMVAQTLSDAIRIAFSEGRAGEERKAARRSLRPGDVWAEDWP